MPGGAPRTTTPEKEELIKLGEDLVTWATEKTKELRYHLNQWYTLKHGLTRKQWDLMCEKPEFQVYYEKARVAITARYVDGSINSTIAGRFLRLYFPELRKEENDTKELDAKMRANALVKEAQALNIQTVDFKNAIDPAISEKKRTCLKKKAKK